MFKWRITNYFYNNLDWIMPDNGLYFYPKWFRRLFVLILPISILLWVILFCFYMCGFSILMILEAIIKVWNAE